jgi:hypothetical protein
MKYSFWSNVKFYAVMVVWLLIIFAMFLVSWGMSFTHIDLATAPKTTGVISLARVGLSDAGKSVRNSFIFEVDNNPTGYWIYRAGGDYSNLINSLSVGTKVTVYHSGTIDSNGLYTAYQVQDGEHIDYATAEYEGKEKWAGRLIGLPGSVVLLVVMFFQIKKRNREGRLASDE